MDCDRADVLLNAYIDRELDLSSSLTLETHLSTCRACREKHQRLTRLVADLQAVLERYPAPVDLRDRLTLTIRPSSIAPAPDAPASAIESDMVVFPPRASGKSVPTTRSGLRFSFGRRQLLALAASIAGVALVS